MTERPHTAPRANKSSAYLWVIATLAVATLALFVLSKNESVRWYIAELLWVRREDPVAVELKEAKRLLIERAEAIGQLREEADGLRSRLGGAHLQLDEFARLVAKAPGVLLDRVLLAIRGALANDPLGDPAALEQKVHEKLGEPFVAAVAHFAFGGSVDHFRAAAAYARPQVLALITENFGRAEGLRPLLTTPFDGEKVAELELALVDACWRQERNVDGVDQCDAKEMLAANFWGLAYLNDDQLYLVELMRDAYGVGGDAVAREMQAYLRSVLNEAEAARLRKKR